MDDQSERDEAEAEAVRRYGDPCSVSDAQQGRNQEIDTWAGASAVRLRPDREFGQCLGGSHKPVLPGATPGLASDRAASKDGKGRQHWESVSPAARHAKAELARAFTVEGRTTAGTQSRDSAGERPARSDRWELDTPAWTGGSRRTPER